MFRHVPLAITPSEKCVRFSNGVQQPRGKKKSCNTRENRSNFKSASILCVVSLNGQKNPWVWQFPPSLLFNTSTLSKMSREQSRARWCCLLFFGGGAKKKKFGSRQRTWTSDLCVGEQLPPGALKANRHCQGRWWWWWRGSLFAEFGERRVGKKRGGRKSGKRERKIYIMVQLSSAPQLWRPWVSTINLHTHWCYT